MQSGSRIPRRRSFEGFEEEEISPTEGLINLVDAMLVFSCGLLLALVMFWQVDLSNPPLTELEQGAEVTALDEVQEEIEKSEAGGTGYEKMGTVYRDPETGQLYMLEEEASGQ